MNLVAPAAALFFGVLLLLIGWQVAAVVDLAATMGVDDGQVETAHLAVRYVGLGGGAMATVTGVVGFWRTLTDRQGIYAPYIAALTPVAKEYGRSVESHPKDGLGFATGAEGVRLEILVQPAGPSRFVSIWMQAPSRQRLLFVPADASGTAVDDADWRLVGNRGNWVLRAEMPSVARPLLNDGGLVDDLTTLMRHREVRAVKHDQRGVEILADIVPAEDLRLVLRDALMACRRLRRSNS